MTRERMSILCTGVLLVAGAGAVCGKDWPEWCGQPSRNMAAKSDQRLPDWADCGGKVVIGTTWEDGKEACFLCLDEETGRRLGSFSLHELDESFYPSPILAAGRIYAMDNSGTMHVFRASKAFVSVADPILGEESLATPAFASDTIFIRGKDNLYCVGPKQGL